MARKNLLKGLMVNAAVQAEKAAEEGAAPAPGPAASDPAPSGRPRYSKGAIGAVSQSLAELKSRALTDLDPFSIEDGGVTDRLDDDDPEAHAMLVASLRDYGQQVPVLVRPHPGSEGRYQIVYGRRRIRALRDLGQPVKAMIRDLDDRELVVAQGQENTARKDLTFIEKANFARQMRDAGYDRKIICDALHVDKTQISRMLSVADSVPLALIEAIGAAPSVGRDRWLALANLMSETGTGEGEAIAMANFAEAKDSDGRFQGLMKALALPRRRAKQTGDSRDAVLKSAAGEPVGKLTRRDGKITMTIPAGAAEGFDEWLEKNFDRIHGDWLASRRGKGR
ncbi:plasmid partitioning protein RepB [Mangrovicoccus sp. HB161399]|uniref:plasmid partitioning protein RepB n=1 Tax=Mangrovicoccus sp. HB161399 TaxID=2720392 RepID=UPI0015546D42|nr:plasmid partitioning protein RepB [Mangrovicoccus sp. HB161399]